MAKKKKNGRHLIQGLNIYMITKNFYVITIWYLPLTTIKILKNQLKNIYEVKITKRPSNTPLIIYILFNYWINSSIHDYELIKISLSLTN